VQSQSSWDNGISISSDRKHLGRKAASEINHIPTPNVRMVTRVYSRRPTTTVDKAGKKKMTKSPARCSGGVGILVTSGYGPGPASRGWRVEVSIRATMIRTKLDKSVISDSWGVKGGHEGCALLCCATGFHGLARPVSVLSNEILAIPHTGAFWEGTDTVPPNLRLTLVKNSIGSNVHPRRRDRQSIIFGDAGATLVW